MDKNDEFFLAFKNLHNLDASITFVSSGFFEHTEYWANELLRLVLIGQKKATASSYLSYKLSGEELPKIGDYHIITDFYGNPKCIIQTTHILIMPFKDFTYEIVKREGEDDTLESWRKGHEKFFSAEGLSLGYTFTEDMLVVFEDFNVVYQV